MDRGSDKAGSLPELCTAAPSANAAAAAEVAGGGHWPAGAGEMSTDPPDWTEMPATHPERHEIDGGDGGRKV